MLDGGGLDVHRHIPRAGTEADGEQADRGHPGAACDPADTAERHPGGGQHGAPRDNPARAEPAGHPTGEREADHRTGRHGEQQGAQLARRDAQGIAHLRDPGHPTGEGEPVDGEHRGDGVAGCGQLDGHLTPPAIDSIRLVPGR
jgi:hypothetical protein